MALRISMIDPCRKNSLLEKVRLRLNTSVAGDVGPLGPLRSFSPKQSNAGNVESCPERDLANEIARSLAETGLERSGRESPNRGQLGWSHHQERRERALLRIKARQPATRSSGDHARRKEEIALRNSRQATVLAEYWVAVQKYLRTGERTLIDKFRGKRIKDATESKSRY